MRHVSDLATEFIAKFGFPLFIIAGSVNGKLDETGITTPFPNDEAFQLAVDLHLKKWTPERAVVASSCSFRVIPANGPSPLVAFDKDPMTQECIRIEGANVDEHVVAIVPYHRQPDGTFVFEDPMEDIAIVGNGHYFLKGRESY
ncbi:hypothetical protein ACFL2Q_02840, partial [Thermodesulfobacteriota bacterium]